MLFPYQTESERLPPTQAALHQAILRAHYQLLVWNNDHVANPVLPSPEGYGWQDEDGKWVPVITNLPPAPEAIIEKVIDRPTQTPLCGFTFAMQKPLIKASL